MGVKKLEDTNFYSEQLKQLKRIHSFLPEDSKNPSFTILDIFNKSYSEDSISDYLAYILNPSVNGIGFEPIKKLVEFGKAAWQAEYEGGFSTVEINREFLLSNNRRVDLVINVNESLIIAIENKVFTEEHGKQTIDYAEKLKDKFPDYEYLFILLSPDGRKALSDQFLSMSYRELHASLKTIRYNFIDNIKKTIFFEDFLTHLEERFMKSSEMSISKKTELYIEYGSIINDIRKSLEHDYKQILNKILQMIVNHLNEYGGGRWEYNSNPNRNWHQIYKVSWRKKNIHFEIRMSEMSLSTTQTLEFAIDIESQGKKDFIDKLESAYSNRIKELILQNELDRNVRAITFVSKKYNLLTVDILNKQPLLQNEIENMINDFISFIPLLDATISE